VAIVEDQEVELRLWSYWGLSGLLQGWKPKAGEWKGLGVNRSNKNSSVSRKDYEWVQWAGEHLQSFPFCL